MAKYSLETKLAAVHAYLDGTESFKVTAQKYNVDITMLKEWVASFRNHGVKNTELIPHRLLKYMCLTFWVHFISLGAMKTL